MNNAPTSIKRISSVIAGVVSFVLVIGCSSDDKNDAAGGGTCNVKVDRFKELLVVDETVVQDPRSWNATRGRWSFRHAIEQMVPDGMTPSDFVARWLKVWSSSTRVNASAVAPRPLVGTKLVCPWLRSTPSNECNDDCSSCAQQEFDLAKAPFRLLAISNRMDLRKLAPDGAGTGQSGEGRLLFGMTSGPADDPASMPLGMTVIFEYELIGSPKDWATKWHALGSFDSFGEPYKAALEQVTNGYVLRVPLPDGRVGSALSQLRTNEREFDWQWQLREFKLRPEGLILGPLENTPDAALNNTPILRDYLIANRDLLLTKKFALPDRLRGATINQGFRWTVTGIDEPLRKAFAGQTCNGCHQSEETPVDSNFHVSPFQQGVAKISRFVNNPEDPEHDDLAARENSMRAILCAP